MGEVDGYYFCDVFSRIDAKDKSQAYSFEDQINSDPDSVDRSLFAAYLDEILEADEFDISIPRMDIVEVESSSGGGSDTTEIIVWFLGVSAVCAVGALLLIVCWRKFGAVDDSEMDNGINLEFLLDPNGGGDPNRDIFTSPMHIEPDGAAEEDAQQYHSMQPDLEDEDDMEEVVPIRKKKPKIKYFSRLDDGATGAGGDEDAGNDGDDDRVQEEEQYEEEDTEEEDDLANPLMDDYNPPNFSRI